jgi:hypothetical protein
MQGKTRHGVPALMNQQPGIGIPSTLGGLWWASAKLEDSFIVDSCLSYPDQLRSRRDFTEGCQDGRVVCNACFVGAILTS